MVSPILFLTPDVFVKNIALSLKKFNYSNDSNSLASCRGCQKTGNITQVLLTASPTHTPQGWVRTGTPVDMQVTWAATARFRQQASWPVLSIYPGLAGGGVAWGRAWSLADKGPFLQIPLEHPAAFCKGIPGAWGF